MEKNTLSQAIGKRGRGGSPAKGSSGKNLAGKGLMGDLEASAAEIERKAQLDASVKLEHVGNTTSLSK